MLYLQLPWMNLYIKYGRPFGGTALFWPKGLLHDVNTYSIAEWGRVVALSFYSNRGANLMFNLHMPCYSNFNEEQSMQVLECMSFIEYVMVF